MDKRYLLFMIEQYYPSGGMHDMVGSFDTQEAAEECVNQAGGAWRWHIYDRIEGRIVTQHVNKKPSVY